MNKYLTEFVGTFFLVLTITLAVISEQPLAALAIGGILMVMIFMGGHISGGHYNPAVSLAALMRGVLPASDFPMYLIAQIAGGIAAAFLGNYLADGSVAIAPGDGVDAVRALITEILYTFALALTVLRVATTKATANNSFYGLAIGFTVVAAAISAGWLSGGAFNPAVGLGLALAGGTLSTVWIYIVGPLIGGALAALFYQVQGMTDKA